MITDSAASATDNSVLIMKSTERVALAGAPSAWFAGWAIMRLWGHQGPGVGWTAAHTIWIVAMTMFALAALAIHRLQNTPRGHTIGPISKIAARAGLSASIAGALALIAQMVIDLTVGFRSATDAAMDAHYQSVFAVPGLELAIYQLAPAALFVGLVTQVVSAATRNRVATSAAVLIVIGAIASALGHGAPGGFRVIEGIGTLVILAAMIRVMQSQRHRGVHRMPHRPAAVDAPVMTGVSVR